MFSAHSAGRFIKRLLLLALALGSIGMPERALAMILTHTSWDIQITDWSDGATVEGEPEAEEGDRSIWSRETDMTSSTEPAALNIYPFEGGQGGRLSFERVGD